MYFNKIKIKFSLKGIIMMMRKKKSTHTFKIKKEGDKYIYFHYPTILINLSNLSSELTP